MLSRFRPARSRRRMGVVAPLLIVLGLMLSSAAPAGAATWRYMGYLAFEASTTIGPFTITRTDPSNGAIYHFESGIEFFRLNQNLNQNQVELSVSPGTSSILVSMYYMEDIWNGFGTESITVTGYDARGNAVGSITRNGEYNSGFSGPDPDNGDLVRYELTFSAPAVRIVAVNTTSATAGNENNSKYTGRDYSLLIYEFDEDAEVITCDKPGHGFGDKNHEHCGPPGQLKKQG